MYTSESFCNKIWSKTYTAVQKSVSKKDYVEISIPKKKGIRQIQLLSKESALYKTQQNLLRNYLQEQPLPTCVKGFVKGESYISYLKEHVGAVHFMRVDLKDFFPTIKKDVIKRELKTRIECDKADDKSEIVELICDIVTYNNVLPQGASTSPMMSNIVMARTDQRILKYCQKLNVRYTRYADDLLFSSADFDFQNNPWFLRKVKHILNSIGCKINYSKLKYGKYKIILNGYVVTKEEVKLSRSRLSDIRHLLTASNTNQNLVKKDKELYLRAINNIDLKHRDLDEKPFETVFQFVQYLNGYRSYLISLLDDGRKNSFFQKELKRLIRRIEKEVDVIY